MYIELINAINRRREPRIKYKRRVNCKVTWHVILLANVNLPSVGPIRPPPQPQHPSLASTAREQQQEACFIINIGLLSVKMSPYLCSEYVQSVCWYLQCKNDNNKTLIETWHVTRQYSCWHVILLSLSDEMLWCSDGITAPICWQLTQRNKTASWLMNETVSP